MGVVWQRPQSGKQIPHTGLSDGSTLPPRIMPAFQGGCKRALAPRDQLPPTPHRMVFGEARSLWRTPGHGNHWEEGVNFPIKHSHP